MGRIRGKFFLPVLLLLAASYSDAGGAPSPSGIAGPKEYVNRPLDTSLQAYHALVSGTKRVIVILVDFPGTGTGTYGAPTMTAADKINLHGWFKSSSRNFEDYYDEVSYGQLDLDVTYAVCGGTKSTLDGSEQPFEVPQNISYYGQDTQASLEDLLDHAISTSQVTASNYDNVLVAHAGYGNESTAPTYPGDILSVSVSFVSPHGSFTTGAIVPAREAGSMVPFGVMCHEFGHQLGLPDIYATDTSEKRVGIYALMDSGSWNNLGNIPAHPCSWSKVQLGWISPVVLTEDVNDQLLKAYYLNAAGSVFRFNIPGTEDLEYFLLAYRASGGYDSASTNPDGSTLHWGVSILHVDANIASAVNIADNSMNSSSQVHPGVNIVGEGTWDTGRIFTSPDSDSYDGSISGITIYDFTDTGSNMTFDATVASFGGGLSIKEEPLGYPNPIRKGASVAILSFKLSEPEDDRSVRIYAVDGSLIRKFGKNELDAAFIQDNEVVYQAKWDLKNDAGERVATGIYIILVRAGDKIKTGRMAVIRD